MWSNFSPERTHTIKHWLIFKKIIALTFGSLWLRSKTASLEMKLHETFLIACLFPGAYSSCKKKRLENVLIFNVKIEGYRSKLAAADNYGECN